MNVFIPTTPNPTSGFLLFCPEGDLVYLEMSVEEAVKLVVSGGIVTPPAPTASGKTEAKKTASGKNSAPSKKTPAKKKTALKKKAAKKKS
jgi:uncharacterized membrane protein